MQDAKRDEDKLIQEAVSTLRKVQCRLCKGEHWTTKCPYKDNLQSYMDQANEKAGAQRRDGRARRVM